MARLFITNRELNFISDITKEIIKDVIGQKIFYYPISDQKTKSHGIYNESLQKVFDNPITIDCLVDSNFQTDTKVDQFGVDAQYRVEVFLQYRDVIEKGIQPSIGDYFSFSFIFYEISELNYMRNIYGMPDHIDGVKLVGTRVRQSQFKALVNNPSDFSFVNDPGNIQNEFYQQRGFDTNAEGVTGDVRDLVRNGVLEPAISGPREISQKGDKTGVGSSFYDEE